LRADPAGHGYTSPPTAQHALPGADVRENILRRICQQPKKVSLHFTGRAKLRSLGLRSAVAEVFGGFGSRDALAWLFGAAFTVTKFPGLAGQLRLLGGLDPGRCFCRGHSRSSALSRGGGADPPVLCWRDGSGRPPGNGGSRWRFRGQKSIHRQCEATWSGTARIVATLRRNCDVFWRVALISQQSSKRHDARQNTLGGRWAVSRDAFKGIARNACRNDVTMQEIIERGRCWCGRDLCATI